MWKKISEKDSSHTVVFGGDTNLRDWEVIASLQVMVLWWECVYE